MPDAPRHPDHAHHPHPDLPPPGREAADATERFAEALDAFVIGVPAQEFENRSLARLTATAGAIQRRDGVWMTPNGHQSATTLGEGRKQQIWEDLMAHYPASSGSTTAQARQPAPFSRFAALMQPWVEVDDERPARGRKATAGPLRFAPDVQPATTFALVIAVLIGIGAAFSTIVDPGSPGVTPTASAEGLAGIVGQTGPATPGSRATELAALPTADPADEFQRPIPVGGAACPVEPRPIEEIAVFLRDPGPVTPRAYLPATAPDPAVAAEVARVGRMYLACEYAGPVNVDRALQTPRFIYEDRANAYFREAGGAPDIATPKEREQLVALALGEDPGASQIIVTEQAISREESEAAGAYDSVPIAPPPGPGTPPILPSQPTSTPGIVLPEQIDQTFRPEQAVQLADGRIALPETYLVDPSDLDLWLSADPDDAYPDTVWFSIFAPDATRDGEWALDERLVVCLGNGLCDDFYEDVDPTGDALFPAPATPIATPATSVGKDDTRSLWTSSAIGGLLASRYDHRRRARTLPWRRRNGHRSEILPVPPARLQHIPSQRH